MKTNTGLEHEVSHSPLFGNILPQDYSKTVSALKTPKELISAEPAVFDIDTWDGSIETRRFDISASGLTIECFGTPSSTKKLFILPSAAGRKTVDTSFQRVGWHPWLDGICLNIEDPTYKILGEAVTPGWFFGTKETHAIPVVADMVRKVQAHYGIANEDTFFIGTSSGGFTSLWLADMMQGTTAIAGNPQFYATRWSSAERFKEFGIDLWSPEFYGRTNLDHIDLNGPSRYLVVSNSKSKVDFQDQVPYFLQAKDLPALHYGLNRFGNFYIYCKTSDNKGTITPHNVLEDAKQFRALFDIFNSPMDFQSMASAMDMVHEIDYSRQSLSDKLFFIRQWNWLVQRRALPLVMPNAPVEANTLRLPLKNSAEVYFELKLAPKAKTTTISLKTENPAHLTKFKNIAARGLGTLSEDKGVIILGIGQYPEDQAKASVIKAINAITPFFPRKYLRFYMRAVAKTAKHAAMVLRRGSARLRRR